jgi:membrane protein
MVEHKGPSGTLDRLHGGADSIKERYAGSHAEHLVQRLGAMDVINRGMIFAAVLLLCFFPFLIIIDAWSGRSTVSVFSRHLGLNHQAASDVSHLFASSSSTSSAVTGLGYVFFIIGGIAAATALEDLYVKAFGVESKGIKDTPRRLAWLAS